MWNQPEKHDSLYTGDETMKKTEFNSFRTDRDTKLTLDALAAEKKWSISQLSEEIIKEWLEAHGYISSKESTQWSQFFCDGRPQKIRNVVPGDCHGPYGPRNDIFLRFCNKRHDPGIVAFSGRRGRRPLRSHDRIKKWSCLTKAKPFRYKL